MAPHSQLQQLNPPKQFNQLAMARTPHGQLPLIRPRPHCLAKQQRRPLSPPPRPPPPHHYWPHQPLLCQHRLMPAPQQSHSPLLPRTEIHFGRNWETQFVWTPIMCHLMNRSSDQQHYSRLASHQLLLCRSAALLQFQCEVPCEVPCEFFLCPATLPPCLVSIVFAAWWSRRWRPSMG